MTFYKKQKDYFLVERKLYIQNTIKIWFLWGFLKNITFEVNLFYVSLHHFKRSTRNKYRTTLPKSVGIIQK